MPRRPDPPEGTSTMSSKRKEEGLARAVSRTRTRRPDPCKPESERDSGFSDASSEHLSVVDRGESGKPAQPGGAGKGGARPSSQASQLAMVGGFSHNLSPMIIMNNVLLKQVHKQPGDSPPALKPWGFSPAVEMVQQPRVVFLQPVVSARGPPVSSEPPSKRRRHRKYLPILKSYPKIAPHPGDSPHQTSSSSSSSGASSCSTSSFSSSVASSLKSCSLTSSHQERHRRDKQQGSVSGCSTPCSLPASPLPLVTLTDSAPARVSAHERPVLASRSESGALASRKPTDSKTLEASLQQTPIENGGGGSSSNSPSVCSNSQEPVAIDNGGADGDSSNKRKRFCNTYNILSKSGLLDITLRTKELIRQNRRTQGDLERLRQHTDLFMQVMRSGDVSVFDRLQTCMKEEADRERNA